MKSKKAMMGMHSFGGLDLVIILIGAIMGIVLAIWLINTGVMSADQFPIGQAAAAATGN